MAAVVVLGLGGTALGASSGNVGECSAKANFGCSSWEGGDRLNCNDPNKGIMDWVARPVRSDNYVVEVDREDYVRVPGEYLDVSRANRCRPPRRSGRLWSTTLRATFTTTTRRQDRRSGSVRWGRASKFCENSFHICSSLPSHLVSSPKTRAAANSAIYTSWAATPVRSHTTSCPVLAAYSVLPSFSADTTLPSSTVQAGTASRKDRSPNFRHCSSESTTIRSALARISFATSFLPMPSCGCGGGEGMWGEGG